MDRQTKTQLWWRWVVANAVGEMIGLGTTFGVGVAFFSLVGEPQAAGEALAFGAVMVATGAIEGTVVGLAQWMALRAGFPAVRRQAWILATLVGALVAWFLGSLPSTLMAMGAEEGAAPAAEPDTWLMLLLAGAMGLVAGVVLAVPQWRVLRRAVDKAWWWLPGNSVAWFVGMPIIFALIDLVQRASTPLVAVLLMALGLALTGAVVGAIHGWVLVQLAAQKRPPAESPSG
jgi:hypothetical protein